MASIPDSRSTPARLIIPKLAAGTNPYHPGGAVNPVNSSRPASICLTGSWNSLGSAMSRAVMKTSRRSRSIQRVESRIFVSNLTKAISRYYRYVTPLRNTYLFFLLTRCILNSLLVDHSFPPSPKPSAAAGGLVFLVIQFLQMPALPKHPR